MPSQTILNVSRTQWAMGPGFFHTSTISIEDQLFTYVYDCGSLAKRKTRVREIEEFHNTQPNNKTVDVCFVSHFDVDHINGIKDLANIVGIERFIIPFIGPDDRIFNAAQQLSSLGQNLSSYFINNNDELYFFANIIADPESTLRRLTTNNNLNSVLTIDPEGDDEGRIVTLNDEDSSNEESAYFSVHLTQGNTVQLNTSTHRYGHCTQLWEWKLYTLKAFTKGIRSQFIDQVKQDYPRSGNKNSPLRPTEIKDLIINNQKILIKAYNTAVKQAGFRTRNSTSLMLYSGPPTNPCPETDNRVPFAFFDYTHCYHRGSDPRHPISTPTHSCCAHYYVCFPSQPPIGWLGLGDIEISKMQTRVDEINNKFKDSKPLVSTYCLPHHGSLNDWHKSLLTDFKMAPICVVSANGKYGHPSHQVILDVNSAGSTLMVTTTEEASRLYEYIEITLIPQPLTATNKS